MKPLYLLPLLLLAGCGAPMPVPAIHANAVKGPAADLVHSPRVAFMGDSQAFAWVTAEQPTHPLWLNAASSGPELTSSMLARFQADVIDLHPDVVVIFAGTTDILQNDSTSEADSFDVDVQVFPMAQMAQTAGIKVIVTTLPNLQAPLQFNPIDNPFIDSYDTLVGEQFMDGSLPYALARFDNVLPADWTTDGITPNATGSALLTGIVEPIIDGLKVGGVR